MTKQEILNLKNKLLTYSLLSSLFLIPANTNVLNVEATDYNNEYVNNDDSSKLIDNLISYYASVFQIKDEIIKDELMKETGNLSLYEWDHYYVVNSKSHDSVEFAILELTRDIYYNPESYNYSSEEIKSDKEYNVSLSPEEMIAKYSKIYGINKDIALSIVYTECGSEINSKNYKNNNNPAGIGPNMHFLNKEVGIIYFINLLKNNYKCDSNSDENFLTKIASTYCEIPNHWLSLALPFYHNIKEDYLYYKEDLKHEIDIDIYDIEKEKPNQKVKSK